MVTILTRDKLVSLLIVAQDRGAVGDDRGLVGHRDCWMWRGAWSISVPMVASCAEPYSRNCDQPAAIDGRIQRPVLGFEGRSACGDVSKLPALPFLVQTRIRGRLPTLLRTFNGTADALAMPRRLALSSGDAALPTDPA